VQSKAPQFDLAVTVPRLGAVKASAQQGDWLAVSRQLGDIGAADEDQLAVAADVVAQIPGVERMLDDVVRSEPGNIGARTLRAHRRIVQGWEVRSRQQAEHVSAAQFEEFHRHLREAEVELIELCARAPWMALPWNLRLMTARGLELGLSETRRRYDRLAQHHPVNFSAQRQLLQQLCPKWGGTWDQTFEFARGCSASAPAGSASHALVAIAHFEQWVELEGRDRTFYFADTARRSELSTAAERSVLDPAFGDSLHAVGLHTLFAITQSLAGEHTRAARHFEALGDAASEDWYGYFNDPVATYRKHRSQATGGRA
jgi:hypothetical protein